MWTAAYIALSIVIFVLLSNFGVLIASKLFGIKSERVAFFYSPFIFKGLFRSMEIDVGIVPTGGFVQLKGVGIESPIEAKDDFRDKHKAIRVMTFGFHAFLELGVALFAVYMISDNESYGEKLSIVWSSIENIIAYSLFQETAGQYAQNWYVLHLDKGFWVILAIMMTYFSIVEFLPIPNTKMGHVWKIVTHGWNIPRRAVKIWGYFWSIFGFIFFVFMFIGVLRGFFALNSNGEIFTDVGMFLATLFGFVITFILILQRIFNVKRLSVARREAAIQAQEKHRAKQIL